MKMLQEWLESRVVLSRVAKELSDKSDNSSSHSLFVDLSSAGEGSANGGMLRWHVAGNGLCFGFKW